MRRPAPAGSAAREFAVGLANSTRARLLALSAPSVRVFAPACGASGGGMVNDTEFYDVLLGQARANGVDGSLERWGTRGGCVATLAAVSLLGLG